MADNFVTDPGAAGLTFGSDDIGGVHYPITKLTFGALDSQTIASSNAGNADAGTQRVVLATDQTGPTIYVDDADWTATTSSHQLVGGVYTSSERTITDGDTGPISLDVNGHVITSGHADTIALSDDVSNTANILVDESGAFVVQASFPYCFDGATWDRVRGDATNGLLTQVSAIVPGVGATNLGKAEDAQHSSGDTGVMALAVRNDALAALGGTDGDYAPVQVNNNGALWVDVPDAVTDSNNSTTTPINANIDYTGTATDVSPYSGITINIFADQDSDANGMRFQFSSDGTNWDIEVDGGFDYLANTGRTFQFSILAKYFRVIFQNGTTNQTAFRFQTLLHHHSVSLTTIHRADDDLAPDRSCTVTKSILMAQAAGTGNFIPIDSTAGGNLKMSVQEISDGLDIGAGNAGTETQRVSISTDDVNLAAINAGQLADGHNVTLAAAATGGMSHDQLALLAEDNDKVIKGSAGTLYFVSIQSIDATPVYLKFFDAASITPGTTEADFQFMCPANSTAALGGGLVLNFGAQGIQMGTGIVALVATGAALDDNTAVSANEVFVTIGFE